MTSTSGATRPALPVGEAVGQAEASLTWLLVAAGLAGAGGDTIRLTTGGQALRDTILAAAAKITRPMLATLDRGDPEITIRTLQEITRRARGIPARQTTTEGN